MNLKGCRAGGTYSPLACRGKLSRRRGHGKSTTIGLACHSCRRWFIRDRVEPGSRFGHVCYALKAEAKSDYRRLPRWKLCRLIKSFQSIAAASLSEMFSPGLRAVQRAISRRIISLLG